MQHENTSIVRADDVDMPFRQFFELAPDAVIIAELTGPIVLVNRQTERCFGYRRDELIGAEIELLLPQRYRARHPALREGYARQPHVRPMGIGLELYGMRKDGSEFPLEISLSPIALPGKDCVIAVIRDVTEQKRLARQARDALNSLLAMAEERRKLLQFVLDELPGGVYLTRGPDARLVLANYAAEAVWGARWPIGMPMRVFLATTGVQVLGQDGRPLTEGELATVRAARTGEAIRQQQEIIHRPDGLTLPVLLNAVALESRLLNWELADPDTTPPPMAEGASVAADEDASGAAHAGAVGAVGAEVIAVVSEPVYATLVVLQDITAVKEAEQLKDEFITIAAHELKTPLAAVRGYAEMLARGIRQESESSGQEITEWQSDALTVIDDATQRLVELVDDLLDVTRLQAHRLTLRVEPHDLVALARRVIRRAQVTTTRHTITLHTAQAHVVVDIDSVRIEQALGNLLTNAIKYSPAGGEITVEIKHAKGVAFAATEATEDVAPSEMAELCVRDTGIGIPREQQGRIFGRFARADNAAAQGIGGVGLGLYLCRELVERHRGHIWFQSTEGQGTIFFLTLPLTPAEENHGEETVAKTKVGD